MQEFHIDKFLGDSKILKGHKDHVEKVILLNNNCLCTCSYDKTIKIWDLKTTNCINTLVGHS